MFIHVPINAYRDGFVYQSAGRQSGVCVCLYWNFSSKTIYSWNFKMAIDPKWKPMTIGHVFELDAKTITYLFQMNFRLKWHNYW